MRFLSVAERELRAAARQPRIFRARWITAAAFFVLLIWLFWLFDVFRNRTGAPNVFEVLAVLTFIYCLLIGTASTADSVSAEKREGTLGLLFLTNLNSAEIVAGKFCSRALAAVYGLVAIFPMLAMPLLLGGITFDHFWRTVLALLNVILFSLAAGFVASVVCVRQFTAIAFATGLALAAGAGLFGAAAIVDAWRGPKIWVDTLVSFCPLYTLVSADGARIFGRNHYWLSLAVVAGLSALWLLWATWRLARTWRDRPKTISVLGRLAFGRRWQRREGVGRVSLRRRLLDRNPFFWLASPRRISSPFIMFLTLLLVGITVGVTLPFFDRGTRIGASNPAVAFLLAWLWTGLAFHALVLYYAAMVASQRLAEDKQTGALELVLCTPTSERPISRGLWLAYGRRMFFPGLTAALFHLFFIWAAAVALVSDPPSRLPPGITPAQLLWHAWLNLPVSGYQLEWEFSFMLRALVLVLGLFLLAWLTLGWVGRWLGLKMKHPGFAPMTALALLIIPPILEFSLACYLADKLDLDRLPERQFLPLLMWVAVGIGVAHCGLLSWWAGTRLHRDFRQVVTERFQPPSLRQWWRPGWRPVRRLAARAAICSLVLALMVVGFYQYQNWRSRRNWTTFQARLTQNGESLDTSVLWPAPVPDTLNFVQSPAFKKLSGGSRGASSPFLGRLGRAETPGVNYGNAPNTVSWPVQKQASFDEAAVWMSPMTSKTRPPPRAEAALALISGLEQERAELQALGDAARLPFLRLTLEHNSRAIMNSQRQELKALEELHLLFELRACALLALSRRDEAARDVLTSLNLVRLARQSPDVLFSLREQVLLVRSLQPIWEGMADRQWDESQLAAFQNDLAGFHLLADHTNAVRRLVLASIENWRAIADSLAPPTSVPVSGGGYLAQEGWQIQPRGWWLDRCIQLHRAGLNAIRRVDVAGEHVRLDADWEDVRGLPLDNETQHLLQQYNWYGNNPAVVAFAQTAVNQAIIACALERFRIASGRYPDALEELVPAYLARIPSDIIRGRPMIYQLTENGRYCLRGVGPNEKDDRRSKSSDDWLWAYPTNAPSVGR